jgi:hypothetical protein
LIVAEEQEIGDLELMGDHSNFLSLNFPEALLQKTSVPQLNRAYPSKIRKRGEMSISAQKSSFHRMLIYPIYNHQIYR